MSLFIIIFIFFIDYSISRFHSLYFLDLSVSRAHFIFDTLLYHMLLELFSSVFTKENINSISHPEQVFVVYLGCLNIYILCAGGD